MWLIVSEAYFLFSSLAKRKFNSWKKFSFSSSDIHFIAFCHWINNYTKNIQQNFIDSVMKGFWVEKVVLNFKPSRLIFQIYALNVSIEISIYIHIKYQLNFFHLFIAHRSHIQNYFEYIFCFYQFRCSCYKLLHFAKHRIDFLSLIDLNIIINNLKISR